MSIDITTHMQEFAGVSTNPLAWMDGSLCSQTDPELFFPTRQGDHYSANAAKAICEMCDVKDTCVEYAVADPDVYGIWGGTTFHERVAIRRERGIAESEDLDLTELIPAQRVA